jgi:long-chain acyl-CoA synthetase
VSYADLLRRADRHALALRRAGVGAGDRCGLLAAQGASFIELALGILAADACLAPIPDDHRGAVLDDFIARAKLEHLVQEAPGGFTHTRVAEPAPIAPDAERAYRALGPAYLRFTSGTTSERKGVVLSHAAIRARLAAANRGLEIGPSDRVLWLLPLAHHFVVSILLYLRYGAAVLLPKGSLAQQILGFAARERATVLYASPAHCKRLAADTSNSAWPRLRLAISTADGLARDVAVAFRERARTPLVQALGIIEVGLPILNRRAAVTKPEALGQPLPDYEVWLRGDDGKPVTARGSPEQGGELCIRGPGLLDAYLDPFVPASELLVPDGFRTGDFAYCDADGDLFLAGRRANRISFSGMKFFCEEVEAVLAQASGVRECRVFGKPHAQLGEIPVAEIVLEDAASPPNPTALARHCREALPSYKVPREFRFVSALDHTSSGKLRRGHQRDTRF